MPCFLTLLWRRLRKNIGVFNKIFNPEFAKEKNIFFYLDSNISPKMEKEKSPRKKIEYIDAIFTCVSQVQDFNGADGSKAGADDIANILPYCSGKRKTSAVFFLFRRIERFSRI